MSDEPKEDELVTELEQPSSQARFGDRWLSDDDWDEWVTDPPFGELDGVIEVWDPLRENCPIVRIALRHVPNDIDTQGLLWRPVRADEPAHITAADCWCGPVEDDPGVWVHRDPNSDWLFDMRHHA
jgi:hypothetical protein